MSYNATICFKTIGAEEIYPFFHQFKMLVTEKMDEIAEEEFLWMPSIRHTLFNTLDNDSAKRIIDERWAQTSIFTYRYFYLPAHSLLGVFSVPDAGQSIFDASIFFQNSTDQDYEFEEWKGVPAFEAIADKWKNASDETVKKHYEETCGDEWDADENCDLDYYRRTFAYDDVWDLCKTYLNDEDEVVYLALFGHYETWKLNAFCENCKKAYEEWSKR